MFNGGCVTIFDDINSSNIDEIEDFYSKADIKVGGKLPNPSVEQCKEITKDINKDLTDDLIKHHMKSYLSLNDSIASKISSNMLGELAKISPSKASIISAYTKIVYWLKSEFSVALTGNKSVYLVMHPNKYEMYTIDILSRLSNNILIIDDKGTKQYYEKYSNVTFNESSIKEGLKLFEARDITPEIFLEQLKELANTGDCKGYKFMVYGRDAQNEVSNLLYDIGVRGSTDSGLLVYKSGIESPVEFDGDRNITLGMLEKAANGLSGDAKAELVDLFDKDKLASYSVAILLMGLKSRISDIKAVVYWGSPANKAVIKFLSILHKCGIAILVFDTENKSRKWAKNEGFSLIEFDCGWSDKTYPLARIQSTVACMASKEIDQLLYTGDTLGIYRRNMYKSANIVAMHTTIDEIALLFNESVQVRQGFNSDQESVTLPVMYSIINGCDEDYYKRLKRLLNGNQNTLIYRNNKGLFDRLLSDSPFRIKRNTTLNGSFSEQAEKYFDIEHKKLNKSAIKKSAHYKYNNMQADKEEFLLSNIEKLIGEGWLRTGTKWSEESFLHLELETCLSLSQDIVGKLNNHNFTDINPKLICLLDQRALATPALCIVITLLHLCGWDILILVPDNTNVFGENIVRTEFIQHFDLGLSGEYRELSDSKLKNMVNPAYKSGVGKLITWFNGG